jgi:broad specificity phosphatase PhoE
MPITPAGLEAARQVGRLLAATGAGEVSVLTGETRRARETGVAIADALRSSGSSVAGPRTAFALRNPDLYLAGVRVDMVSSEQALADQVDGLTAAGVARLDFYPEFIVSPDRIAWWLRHESPPGDDAASVALRVRRFVSSLVDLPTTGPGLTIAVTHSPLLRAAAIDLLGDDIGEPAWVSGLDIRVFADRTLTATLFP